MSEPFDPYDTWLAIPPDEQPPNCYRLLGIRLWEDRAEVIEHAADQRMAHLKSLAPGTHAGLAQKLLNEVAAARIRLLDPHKKAMYDQRLRKELEAGVGQASPAVTPLADKQPVPPGAPRADKQPVPPGAPRADKQPVPPGAPRAGKQPVPPAPRADKQPGPTADARTATWAPLGQLGEYRLLEKLGEGGMGAVYKAMHTRLGRVVALKVLRKDHLRDAHAVARFDREMKAVGAVDHPNIVRAMDAREIEGTRFLVMEFVEGADLNALGRHGHPLAVADACEIIRQAALGLEHAHRHGLIHRDVKPSNLMVTPQGVVKLLDLGLARFQFDPDAGDEVTGTGTAMGTVDYMAPEQISDSRSVDIRADVYSLGCTLYKLLAGCTPFSGPSYKTAGEKMAAHLRDPVPPLRRVRGDVPAEVRYAAGEHRVRATRPGYRVPEQTIRVEAGQERKVVLRWQPTPNLVLEWAQAERAGAILEIDGAIQEIEPLALKSSAGRLHLRLSPGPHVVRLSRLGYDAIEERVEIVEGKEHLIRPKWKELGLASPPAATLAGKQPVPPAEKGDFKACQTAVSSLEAKYSAIPWYAANKGSIDGAREAAKRGIAEKEAEDLYKEAAGLFTRKELFDLKPIIDKLKADYADTAALTDGDRKPALVEMEKAVANLGKYLTVRQDGKGDFANIQKAIDAAPVNSLIEIQDNGPYNEKLLLGKEGLVVRGGSRCWPTITSGGRLTHFPILVQVDAPRVTLEKLVLTHVGAAGASPVCIAGQLVLRSSIVYSPVSSPLSGGAVRLEDCFFAGAKLGGPIVAKNTFFLAALSGISGSKLENCIIHGTEPLGSSCEMRRCTIRSLLVVDETYVLVDCILTSVQSASANVRIEHCNVFGSPPFIDQAKGGKGCFLGDPQFADPKNFDYRLRPTSPCRGRASDGGDVGFRYTPEIVEVLKAAFDLRRRGIIAF